MSVVHLGIGGGAVSKASYHRARELVGNLPQDGRNQNIMSTMNQLFGANSTRSLTIHPSVLQRMADDPDMMIRYTALVLDMEEAATNFERMVSSIPGARLVSHGYTINADGFINSVTSIQLPSIGGQNQSSFELPEDEEERYTWAELMRQHLESLLSENGEYQTQRLEIENATRTWLA